jgi:hypothetical protein
MISGFPRQLRSAAGHGLKIRALSRSAPDLSHLITGKKVSLNAREESIFLYLISGVVGGGIHYLRKFG